MGSGRASWSRSVSLTVCREVRHGRMVIVKRKNTVTGYQAITPFTLYLQDVQDIYAVVKSVSTTVAIETDVFTGVRTVEELASGLPQGTRRIAGFHMVGSKRGVPRIRVSVDPKEGIVVLADDAPDLIGAQEKIKRIMWRHAAFIPGATLWPGVLLVLGAVVVIAVSSQVVAATLMAGAGVLLTLLGWRLGRSRFARIYLVDEGAAPGLLRRNRDVLLMLAGLALGLLVPVLVPMIRDALN
jgi:hypothetical protein